jgi:transposase
MQNLNPQQRRQQGLARVLATPRRVPPHPRLGGSRGYDVHHRTDLIAMHLQNLPTPCSTISINRWIIRQTPFDMTGNKGTLKLSGYYQLLIVLYRSIFPKCSLDQMRTFLFFEGAKHYGVGKLFSRQDISKAEIRIGITKKRGSTTALQALLPRNIARRNWFWTQPLPLGISNVPRQELIDFDESAFYLQKANRSSGKAFSGVRVREEGPYGHDEKWTLLLAIAPWGLKHSRFAPDQGTSKIVFRNFMRGLLAALPRGIRYVFMWDNLKSHFDDDIYRMIYAAGYRIIARPPYYPCDGPIEYVFNQIENHIASEMYSIKTHQDLINEVHNGIRNITPQQLNDTFAMVGY